MFCRVECSTLGAGTQEGRRDGGRRERRRRSSDPDPAAAARPVSAIPGEVSQIHRATETEFPAGQVGALTETSVSPPSNLSYAWSVRPKHLDGRCLFTERCSPIYRTVSFFKHTICQKVELKRSGASHTAKKAWGACCADDW